MARLTTGALSTKCGLETRPKNAD